jgi:3-oxoacyl-[acyl-carrier protein] reductase
VAAASKGLGFGVAQSLADEGVHVAICGRERASIDEAARRIGHDTVPIVADVASVEGATGFVRDATAALGGVDILVPNAGGPPPGNFAHTTVDQYLDAFELNCRGAIAMCYEAVPAMRAQQWGRVLAITSIAVRQPIATLILSNTARAALTGFLRTLAREVAADGVTVNSLLPGLHLTERTKALHGGSTNPAAGIPAGHMGDAADFGQVAAFLCSEPANFVTGVALQVDGGQYAALL